MKIKVLRADERHRREINRLICDAKTGSGIQGPIRNFWVVRTGGRIVACAGLDFVEPHAAIFTHLVVEKKFRHLGIGSALVEHRTNVARASGVKVLALITMYYHFNFYKRRGFRTLPRIDLPDILKEYWMFTAQRYMKCAVMIREKI